MALFECVPDPVEVLAVEDWQMRVSHGETEAFNFERCVGAARKCLNLLVFHRCHGKEMCDAQKVSLYGLPRDVFANDWRWGIALPHNVAACSPSPYAPSGAYPTTASYSSSTERSSVMPRLAAVAMWSRM